MILKLLLGVWMAAVVVASFLYLPPAAGFAEPESARIVIYHVPNAMVAALSFVIAMVYGIRYLRSRNLKDDARSATAAELGLLFTILAALTGALFARRQWGMWWNWYEPRETSIVVLMLVYGAYLALRAAVDGIERRASLSAVYSILSVPPMVFLMFVLPRVIFSLHPSDTLATRQGLSTEYRIVLGSATLGFLGLYLWLFRIKTAIAEARLKLKRY